VARIAAILTSAGVMKAIGSEVLSEKLWLPYFLIVQTQSGMVELAQANKVGL
jgi:hypothetical protein